MGFEGLGYWKTAWVGGLGYWKTACVGEFGYCNTAWVEVEIEDTGRWAWV
jgi:hypothetical protein